LHSQSVSEVLDDQLSAKERTRSVHLQTVTSDINDHSSKLQDQFEQTIDSTIIRTGGQIADNIGISQDAIKKRNIILPSNKKDNEN
jgi:conjugal transfer mating pair stabilization protein TraG